MNGTFVSPSKTLRKNQASDANYNVLGVATKNSKQKKNFTCAALAVS